MADMSVTLSKSGYDHDKFDVSVTGLNHSSARQLVEMGNKLIFGDPVSASSSWLDGCDLNFVQQQRLIKAAQLVFERDRNKIMTIKFIRELSSLSLKGAKDLMKYACGNTIAPTWIKSAA